MDARGCQPGEELDGCQCQGDALTPVTSHVAKSIRPHRSRSRAAELFLALPCRGVQWRGMAWRGVQARLSLFNRAPPALGRVLHIACCVLRVACCVLRITFLFWWVSEAPPLVKHGDAKRAKAAQGPFSHPVPQAATWKLLSQNSIPYSISTAQYTPSYRFGADRL
jgi:hypothetical protein